MRSVFFLALGAIATLAAARDNAFNIPKDGYEFTAGESTTLKWAPSTQGTVTLKLQHGEAFDSSTGTTIACEFSLISTCTILGGCELTRPSEHCQLGKLHMECPEGHR